MSHKSHTTSHNTQTNHTTQAPNITNSHPPLLEYKNVYKNFGGKNILQNINLQIPHGKIIGLLGKNGMGKTTIIKLANDLLQSSSGTIRFEGRPIGVYSKREISYLPERTYLDKTMRVRDAIKFFSEFYDNFDAARAEQLVNDLDLSLDMKIIKMSKGMQEKLQLILVMSRNVKLYVLDEPLGGVDPATRDYILDTILNNFNEGASVLISTHIISDIERILDRVIFVNHGEITLQADADELRTEQGMSIDEIFRATFKTTHK